MKTTISKAQIEVWGWKEKAFLEVEKLKDADRINSIIQRTAKVIGEIEDRKVKLKSTMQ